MDQLGPLLAAVYSPTTPPEQKRHAEAALQALARTHGALDWALQALGGSAGAGAADLQALFFACSVVDEAVGYRWGRLDAAGQAAVYAALWRAAAAPGGPHFARQKAAAALAHVACLDWPERLPGFWPDLQACLGDPGRRAAGVDVLAATLDHFHSLAQATSAGLKGKVPSALIPDIQRRYSELQPVALATLCSLLQQLAPSLPHAAAGGDPASLGLAARTLRALRHALSDASKLPEQQGVSSAALVGLLFEYVGAARLAPAGGEEGDDVADELAEVAGAALNCTTDLLAKFFGAEQQRQMLEALLPQLQDTCSLVQRRWAEQGGAFHPEDPLFSAFVRLMVQFFSIQLSSLEATPQMGAALQGLLGQVMALTTARRSPVDALLLLEVWHAVLTYLDSFEEQLWEVEDDPQAQLAIKRAVAGYKGPILSVADLLLSTLCPAGSPPPLSLDALSTAPSSGAPMEDWLQAVASGGDTGGQAGQEGAAAEAAEDEADEYAEESWQRGGGGGAGGSPLQPDSQLDVFVRHAEGFIGRAIGTFSSDLLPHVLRRFQAAAAGFAAACRQEAAAAAVLGQATAAAGSGAASGTAAADALLPAFRSMDVCLRLLTRCGPSFPTRGAAEQAASLASPEGGNEREPASGAHAAECMRALFQLAAGWLESVQAVAAGAAAAAQQAGGQPATPPPGAAQASSAGLAAMVQAGARVYKALGSFTATWLSQLLAGLVHGSADPDAAGTAQDLVRGVLASAAALLQAAASPQLEAWRAQLYRPAVWAAESLLSLSSIALSSALKPPPALLEAVWLSEQVQSQLRPVAEASLASPALLPPRASRALWLALSDLALRCWPAQPAAQFDAAARSAAFSAAAGPLVHALQHAAVAGASSGGEAAAVARHAASVAAAVVQSFAGSPKAVRAIVSASLAAPALPSALAILSASPGATPAASGSSNAHARRFSASPAVLKLVAASLEVLGTELGSEAAEQLLGALVQAFASTGGDPSFESDLLMMRLIVTLFSQGGTSRHGQLLLPALHYCLGVWERASAPHAAAASADADPQHVRAAALAAMLGLLRYRWKALVGTGAGGVAAKQEGGAKGSGASVQQQAAAAAAAMQSGQAGAGGSGEGAAVVSRVLQLLLEFFGAAASMAVVLSAADVRLVLEELFELQVATKLYSLPLFAAPRPALSSCLLGLLWSRLYRGAQDELADTLFSLAASNWSEFLLQTLPAAVEARAGPGLGASERAALLGLFGGADLQAHDFERRLLAFLNDAAYYERAGA